MGDDASAANADQITYWNEVSGPKWVRLDDRINAQIVSLGRSAMDHAKVAPGERVLDIGCGCGPTSIELAERVGPSGRVVGFDISAPMLERARENAASVGLRHLSFVQSDAQTHAFESDAFDLVFSRFGVMFFENPIAAFANLRSALEPEGRLTFLCWQGLAQNPWIMIPLASIAGVLSLTPPPPASDDDAFPAPGPFSLADPELVVSFLNEAGFRDPACEALEDRVALAGGLPLEEAIDFVLEMGPAGAAMRDANDTQRQEARAAAMEAVRPHVDEEGAVVLDARCWIVSARAS